MKKVLSLILSLVMVISLLPVTAMAAAGDSAETPITNDAATIGGMSGSKQLYLGTGNAEDTALDLDPTLSGGNAPEAATDVTWTFASSNEAVATVDANGVVTPLKGGITYITVTAEWSKTTTTGEGESAVTTTKYYKETSGRFGVAVNELKVSNAVLAAGSTYTVENYGYGAITLVEKEDAGNIISIDGTTIRAASNKSGDATVTVKLGDKLSKDITVTVANIAKVELQNDAGVALGTSLAVSGDTGSMTLYAAVTDSSNNPVDDVEITWTSSNVNVATVDGGIVTIVGAGSTTIKAAAGSKYDSVTLQVAGISGISGISTTNPTLTLGSKATLSATVAGMSGSGYVVEWESDNTSVISLESSNNRASILAAGIGNATITAKLYKVVSGTKTLMDTATVSISVTGLSYILETTGTLAIGNELTFQAIDANFKNIYGTNATKVIVTPGDATKGTLRYSYLGGLGASGGLGALGAAITAATELTSGQFNSLTFTPVSFGGVYTFNFTITDGTNSMSGSVTIAAGYKAQDIQVSMASAAQVYTFGSTNGINERTSVYDEILAAVAPSLRTAAYVKFTTLGTSGTLYTNSGLSEAVKTNSFYSMSDLYTMTFRPTTGTWTAEYVVYDMNQYPILSGKIIIGGSVNLEYRTTSGGTVLFKDEDFQALWKQSYPYGALSYVTFVYPTNGTLRNNGIALTSTTADSTKLYAGTTGTGALSTTTYTAPVVSSYGKFTLYFNVWGYTGTGAALQTLPGSLTVYVTKNAVSDITYSTPVNAAKSLNKDDFSTMINYALGSSYNTWTISFDELPAETNGVLLSYYNSTSNYTKAVAGQEYYYTSLSDFRFVPYTGYSGTVTIPFTVRIGVEEVIKANLIIKVGEGYTYATTSEGVNMKLETFYNSNASDPVAHISFKQPAKGKLYYNYTAGAGTAVTALDYYYTVPSLATVSLALPLTSVKYIPEANQSGDVTIEYTAYTASGQSHEGSIVIRVISKTVSSQFKDVTSNYNWAADSVDFMYAYGIVKGQDTAMTQFGPAGKMSRGDLVLILYRLAGSPAVTGVANPFTDVKTSDYYYNAIMWAYKNGVVDGISATQFAPTGDVTRQQIAAILYRYETKVLGQIATGMQSFAGYSDAAKVQSYASTAMQWAVGNGYITGTTTTTLDPAANATRAQVAVMLHRYLTY